MSVESMPVSSSYGLENEVWSDPSYPPVSLGGNSSFRQGESQLDQDSALSNSEFGRLVMARVFD